MGKLKNLMIETDEEREVFERLQRDNALQALHDENERLGLYKDVYGEKPVAITELMDELATARMLIRELGDRLAKLEKPVDNLDRMSKPNKRPLPSKWAGLTDEEKNND